MSELDPKALEADDVSHYPDCALRQPGLTTWCDCETRVTIQAYLDAADLVGRSELNAVFKSLAEERRERIAERDEARQQLERSCCGHASDCAVHNAPAYEPGACDCGFAGMTHEQALDSAVEAFDNQENYEKSYKRMWEEIGRLRTQRDRALAEQDAIKDLLLLLQDEVASGLRLRQKTFNALVKLQGFNP